MVIVRINFDGVVPTVESDEFVEVANRGGSPQNMAGWKIVSVRGGQTYNFPASLTIAAGQSCRIYTNELHPESCGLSWGVRNALWNNSGDRANLLTPSGAIESSFGYGSYVNQ